MSNCSMKRGLQCALLCGLLFVQNIATEAVQEEKGGINNNRKNGVRRLGLEDYMSYTPRPTPAPGTSAPAPTTIQPTTRAPTKAPTSAPSLSPSDSPTDGPTRAPTLAPTTPAPTVAATTLDPTVAPTTLTPTLAPTTLAPSEAPTDAPTDEVTAENTAKEPETIETTETEPPTEEEKEELVEQPSEEEEEGENWNLFSETKPYEDSLGSVSVDFSLYSPNVTVAELNFEKLQLGIRESIDGMICDLGNPVRDEEGVEYCAVRDDLWMTNDQTRKLIADYNTTVMALSATLVKDGSAGSNKITWSTWRLSWDVLQFSPAWLESIEQTHGSDLDEAKLNDHGIAMLQEMMTVNMEQTLESRDLQQDINDYMKDIMLVTSFVGEEVSTYKIFVPQLSSTSPSGSELEDDGEGGGLMVILFFAGLGVACLVIVGLLYFSFRSRRSRIRRKRTIVILDDTGKESEEVEKEKGHGTTTTESATPVTPRAPIVEPKEAAQAQEKVIVMETENAMKQDPPQADNADNAQQRWEGESVDEEEQSISPEDGDVESQWGRSAAQSSAYTGSISAITGVSGLEQSDTWSVGSMSIDLAEWG